MCFYIYFPLKKSGVAGKMQVHLVCIRILLAGSARLLSPQTGRLQLLDGVLHDCVLD